jgi:hypothetical protein
LGGVRKEDERPLIHSPRVLENKNRMAEIRIITGSGSLAFFID